MPPKMSRLSPRPIILVFAGCFICAAAAIAQDQEKKSSELSQRELAFQQSLYGASLRGFFTVLKPGAPTDQPPKLAAETYDIDSVTKLGADMWQINARIKYGATDVTVPLPLKVKWAGDTPVIIVDKMAIPGAGTYSARVLFHDGKYVGTWSGAKHGGQLMGEITRKLQPQKLGQIYNLHRFGPIYLAGQPQPGDFATLKARGVKSVISLRKPGEVSNFDQPDLLRKLGMDYSNPCFRDPSELTDEVFDEVRAKLNDPAQQPVMLHCGSANRVGAIWLAHRVLDAGIPLDQAKAEAKEVGLRSQDYEAKALDYIKRSQK